MRMFQPLFRRATCWNLLVFGMFLVSFFNPQQTSAFSCPGGEDEINPSECLALKQIYESLGGPNWLMWWGGTNYIETPWSKWTTPQCSGGGISCSPGTSNRHVTGLSLVYYDMVGTLPNDAFAALPYLHFLQIIGDRGNSNIQGSIPSSIAGMNYLYDLQIFSTNISGTIPENLLGNQDSPFFSGYNSGYLNLSRNNLSGSLPQVIGKEIGGTFWVTDNPDLGGRIPSAYISEHYRLSYFDISGTKICEPQDSEMQHWLHSIYDYKSSDITCDQPPNTPNNLTASDGTSDINVIVTWSKSDASTDHYIVERSSDGSNWKQLAKVAWSYNSAVKYYDKNAIPAIMYAYRVKACSDKCSGYSNMDNGYRAFEPPDPITVTLSFQHSQKNLRQLTYSWPTASWPANYYVMYLAKTNTFITEFNEDLFDVVSGNYFTIYSISEQNTSDSRFEKFMKRTFAVKACLRDEKADELTCGKAAVMNNIAPPGITILKNLLLLKK